MKGIGEALIRFNVNVQVQSLGMEYFTVHCMIRKHTNGGCKCLRHDPLLAERVLYLHKKEIKRLRAENESLRQSFPVVPGPVAQADLDWALRGEIEELKAENRQWAAYCGKLRDKLCEEYQADFDQMVGEEDEND